MGQGYSTEEGKLKTGRIYQLFSHLPDKLTREAEPQPESVFNKASGMEGFFCKKLHNVIIPILPLETAFDRNVFYDLE